MSAADRWPFTGPSRMRLARLRAEIRYTREYSGRLRGRAAEVRTRTIGLPAQIGVALASQKSTGGGDGVLFELASSHGMISTAWADRSRGGDARAFTDPSRADHATRLAEAIQLLLRAQSPRSGVLAVGVPLDRDARRRRTAPRASVVRGRQ